MKTRFIGNPSGHKAPLPMPVQAGVIPVKIITFNRAF
jgi:hypothetical protein